MRGLLLRFVGTMLALWITVKLGQLLGLGIWLGAAEGGTGTSGVVVSAALVVIVLALVNAFIRPVLMMFALPLNCMTFGLFGVILNALLFWIVGSGIVPGFHVKGFLAALFGSIVMGLTSAVINQAIAPRE